MLVEKFFYDINYNNIHPWEGAGDYEYTLKLTPVENDNYKMAVTQFIAGGDTPVSERVVSTKYGVRFNVVQTGTIGRYQAQVFILQFTTSLTLVTCATTLIAYFLKYVSKDKVEYKAHVYGKLKHLGGGGSGDHYDDDTALIRIPGEDEFSPKGADLEL